jgi:hypothetical protein
MVFYKKNKKYTGNLKKLGLSVSLPGQAVRESNLGVWRQNNIPPWHFKEFLLQIATHPAHQVGAARLVSTY